MSTAKFWIIKVPNWKAVNPKQNQQKKFFVLNKMHTDPQFLGISPGARLMFMWVLGEVSRSSREEAWCTPADACRFIGRRPGGVSEALQELVSIEWIQLVSGPPLLSKDKISKVKVSKTKSSTSKDKAPVIQKSEISIQAKAPADAAAVTPQRFYCDVYKARYGHSPSLGPKQAGILSRFAKSFPARWRELIEGYLAMPDSWAVQRSHPVELLECKLNEITRFLATGKVMTKAMTKELEEQVDDHQEVGKIDFRAIAEAEIQKDLETKRLKEGR